MLKKLIVIFLSVVTIQPVFSQKKIILEKVRTLSFNKPINDFLHNAAIVRSIAEDLNITLLKQQQIPLVLTRPITVDFIPYGEQVRNPLPVYADTDTTNLHLYLDIFETSPGAFFVKADNYPADSEIVKRAATILVFKATLFNPDKSIYLNETLNVIVSPGETPGIGNLFGGIRYADLTILPKSFTQLLKAANNILLDPKNELASVEIKVQPGFMADNYLLPKTMNQPRVYVQNKKNISSYSRNGKAELIRNSEPVYEEIMIKGKNPQKYPDDLTNTIKLTPNFKVSDYVFLRQDWRDVARDKNYLIKLTVQVDRNNLPNDPGLLLTNFLPGDFHYLFLENDTIAKFQIERGQPSNGNKIFPSIMTNGYDTLTYQTNPGYQAAPWDVVYEYIVKGTMGKQAFSIKYSGIRNTIKEFYLNNQLVCIAQGKFSPEKFVLFDASLSPELLNRLFMIGFNRFFE
jgi:hypothetical protein